MQAPARARARHAFRPTYANVVATIALVVSLTSGGAWAASKITGRQIVRNTLTGKHIKQHSLTGADVAANSLGGTQINEGSLATVPAATTAANANALGGESASAFLRSDRILTGSANVANVDSVIFTDSRTGLQVRVGPVGHLRLVNTSQTVAIEGRGVGYFQTTLYARDITLSAGQQSDISFDAASFRYGTFLLQRRGASASDSPTLQLTCLEEANDPYPNLSCVGTG